MLWGQENQEKGVRMKTRRERTRSEFTVICVCTKRRLESLIGAMIKINHLSRIDQEAGKSLHHDGAVDGIIIAVIRSLMGRIIPWQQL